MAQVEILQFLLKGDSKGAVKAFAETEASAFKADGTLAKVHGTLGKVGDKFGLTSKQVTTFGAAGIGAAVGVGAAVVQMANKFEHSALAAGKFAQVAKINTETASRFVNVADDLGVSTDDLSAAIGKMAKNAMTAPAAFANLGVQIQRTNTGAIDTQATFYKVVDALAMTKSASEQAAAGTAIFGKGWQALIPLITAGSDKIREEMDKVPKGLIFSSDAIDKARRYKAAMAELGDALQSLVVTIGQDVAPALTGLAKDVSGAIGPLATFIGTGIKIAEWTSPLYLAAKGVELFGRNARKAGQDLAPIQDAMDHINYQSQFWSGPGQQNFTAGVQGVAVGFKDVNSRIVDYTVALATAGSASQQFATVGVEQNIIRLKQYAGVVRDSSTALAENRAATLADAAAIRESGMAANLAAVAQAELSATRKANDLRAAWENLTKPISNDQAWIELQQQIGDLSAAQKQFKEDTSPHEVMVKGHKGTKGTKAHPGKPATKDHMVTVGPKLNAEEQRKAMLDLAAQADAAKLKIDEMLQSIDNIPPAFASQINILVDQGQLDEALAKLAILHRNATFVDSFFKKSHGDTLRTGQGSRTTPYGATGGIVTRPTFALIGEAGPEAVVPLDRTPGSSPLGGVGGGPTVNIHPGAIVIQSAGPNYDGNQLIDAVIRTARTRGWTWIPGVGR